MERERERGSVSVWSVDATTQMLLEQSSPDDSRGMTRSGAVGDGIMQNASRIPGRGLRLILETSERPLRLAQFFREESYAIQIRVQMD